MMRIPMFTMPRRVFLYFAIVSLLLVGATPSFAAETTVFKSSVTGQFAEAYFSAHDPSGCVQTYVYVGASDGTFRETGQRTHRSEVVTWIDQYDYCTGTYLLS